jgi:hypothetical protein
LVCCAFLSDLTRDGYARTISFGANSYAHAVLIKPDGSILAAGTVATTATRSFVAVAQWTPALAVDVNFGYSGGSVNQPPDPYNDSLCGGNAIAYEISSDSIWVAGYCPDVFGQGSTYALTYFPGYGDDESVANGLWTQGVANAIAIQSDHKTLLTGRSTRAAATTRSARCVCLPTESRNATWVPRVRSRRHRENGFDGSG